MKKREYDAAIDILLECAEDEEYHPDERVGFFVSDKKITSLRDIDHQIQDWIDKNISKYTEDEQKRLTVVIKYYHEDPIFHTQAFNRKAYSLMKYREESEGEEL